MGVVCHSKNAGNLQYQLILTRKLNHKPYKHPYNSVSVEVAGMFSLLPNGLSEISSIWEGGRECRLIIFCRVYFR